MVDRRATASVVAEALRAVTPTEPQPDQLDIPRFDAPVLIGAASALGAGGADFQRFCDGRRSVQGQALERRTALDCPSILATALPSVVRLSNKTAFKQGLFEWAVLGSNQ